VIDGAAVVVAMRHRALCMGARGGVGGIVDV